MNTQRLLRRPYLSYLSFILLAVFFGGSQVARPATVGLAWDPNPESDLAGYKLLWGTNSGTYRWTNDVGLVTSAQVSNLVVGTAYYFVVKAYNTARLESGPSNQLQHTPTSNDAPTAFPQSVVVAEDGSVVVTLAGSDPEGASLNFAISRPPANGSLSGTPPTVTYRPNPNYWGSDSFEFTVGDGVLSSAAAAVSISVTPVNDRPTALSQTVSVAVNGSVVITLSGTDVEGSSLSYQISRAPSKGTLTGTAPTLTYRPNVGVTGTDSFEFTASDGSLVSAAATVTINLVAAPSGSGLVAALSFDDGTGSATADASGSSNVGRLLGPVWTSSGRYGAALSFDGLNDMVEIADAASLDLGSAMTLEAWVRPASALTGWRSIIHRDIDTYWLYASCSASQALIPAAGATIGSTVPTVIASTGIPANAWTHLATTYDGARVRLFVNGVEVAGVNQTGTILANSQPVQIGGNTHYGEYFSGVIDEVRIYNRALSAVEIQADMTTPIGANQPVNQRPSAVAQSISLAEDGSASIVLSGTDPEGAALTYAVSRAPGNGTLTGTAPNLTYRPNANYFGADSFEFTASDGSLVSTAATVSITVTAVNDRPVATGRSVTTAEDTSLAFTLAGTDVEGTALTYTISRAPSNGTLSGTPPTLTYVPRADYFGSDSFEFTASDGSLVSTAATVSITVTAVNDRPVATSRSVSTGEDTSLAITLTGTDVEGTALTYAISRAPGNGTLSGTPPTLTYVPRADYFGSDSFEFTASDGLLVSAAATITVSVTAVNDRPQAIAQTLSVAVGGSVAVTLRGSDVEDTPLTFAVVSAPTKGTLSGTAPNLTYRPNAGATGTDFLDFTVSDGNLTSTAARITLNIQSSNQRPTAVAQSVSVAEDGLLAITLSGSDPEGSTLTYAVTRVPTNGTLSGTAPSLGYRPKTNFFGADSFEFTVSDGSLSSTAATVTISVTPVNDRPVATARSLTSGEDTLLAVILTGSDVEGSTLTYQVSRSPTNGTLLGTPPSLSYLPKTNFFGTDSFEFTVSDGSLNSSPATVALLVTNINDRPIAHAKSAVVKAGGSTVVTLSATDADGDSLGYGISTSPRYGWLSGTPPNVTYRPWSWYSGTDTFAFTANDGREASLPGVVTVTVLRRSSPRGDSIFVEAGGTATTLAGGADNLIANDSVVADYRVELLAAPRFGSLALGTDGQFAYRSFGTEETSDSFTYVVVEDGVPSAEIPVAIHIVRILAVERDGSDVVVRVPVSAGWTYGLDANPVSPSASSPWALVAQSVASADGTLEFRDPGAASAAARFYRVRCLSGESTVTTTQAWGFLSREASPRSELAANPFLGPLIRRSRILAQDGVSSVLQGPDWVPGELGPRDGFATHAVVLRSSSGPGVEVGDWWLVTDNTTNAVALGIRHGLPLEVPRAGDTLDIVRLQSIADLFGSTASAARILAAGDSLQFPDGDGNLVQVEFRDDSSNPTGYYVTRQGVTYGPLDGTTITLPPMQGLFVRSLTGGTNLWFAGRTHDTAISSYLSSGYTLAAPAFPVPIDLARSGLVESGWYPDIDGVPSAINEDVLFDLSSPGAFIPVTYYGGGAGTHGWYRSVGGERSPADGMALAPGRAYWMLLRSRTGLFRWRQPMPW